MPWIHPNNPFNWQNPGGGSSPAPQHWWQLDDVSYRDAYGGWDFLADTATLGGNVGMSPGNGPNGEDVVSISSGGFLRSNLKKSWDKPKYTILGFFEMTLKRPLGNYFLNMREPGLDIFALVRTESTSAPDSYAWFLDGTDSRLTAPAGVYDSLNVWYHIARTVDMENMTTELFINGVSVGSEVIAAKSPPTSQSELFLGQYGGDTGNNSLYHQGRLCKWGMWDSVLTPEDITHYASGGEPPMYAPAPVFKLALVLGASNSMGSVTGGATIEPNLTERLGTNPGDFRGGNGGDFWWSETAKDTQAFAPGFTSTSRYDTVHQGLGIMREGYPDVWKVLNWSNNTWSPPNSDNRGVKKGLVNYLSSIRAMLDREMPAVVAGWNPGDPVEFDTIIHEGGGEPNDYADQTAWYVRDWLALKDGLEADGITSPAWMETYVSSYFVEAETPYGQAGRSGGWLSLRQQQEVLQGYGIKLIDGEGGEYLQSGGNHHSADGIVECGKNVVRILKGSGGSPTPKARPLALWRPVDPAFADQSGLAEDISIDAGTPSFVGDVISVTSSVKMSGGIPAPPAVPYAITLGFALNSVQAGDAYVMGGIENAPGKRLILLQRGTNTTGAMDVLLVGGGSITIRAAGWTGWNVVSILINPADLVNSEVRYQGSKVGFLDMTTSNWSEFKLNSRFDDGAGPGSGNYSSIYMQEADSMADLREGVRNFELYLTGRLDIETTPLLGPSIGENLADWDCKGNATDWADQLGVSGPLVKRNTGTPTATGSKMNAATDTAWQGSFTPSLDSYGITFALLRRGGELQDYCMDGQEGLAGQRPVLLWRDGVDNLIFNWVGLTAADPSGGISGDIDLTTGPDNIWHIISILVRGTGPNSEIRFDRKLRSTQDLTGHDLGPGININDFTGDGLGDGGGPITYSPIRVYGADDFDELRAIAIEHESQLVRDILSEA